MSEVTTTLVVRFSPGSTAGDGLRAEIDTRPDGLNQGKSHFLPGDSVGFLVYLDPGVEITRIVPTLGVVTHLGIQAVDIDEFVPFADETEARLRAVPSPGGEFQWVGRDGGAISFAGGVARVTEPVIALLHASYTALPMGFRLTSIPTEVAGLSEFEVMIYIEGRRDG